MNTTTQSPLSIDELVRLTCEAIFSLDLRDRLKHTNPGDHVYFLTPDAYTEICALGGNTCTPDLSGREYPSADMAPFHAFVREGMNDNQLWGFVPLTEEARKLLERPRYPRDLVIITNGEPVGEKGDSYNLYM